MLQQEKMFDYLVFIGRFQPFHLAHQEVIEIALSMSEKVILILGSAQNERTIKNPFSVVEREHMILGSFSEHQRQRLICVSMIDLYHNEKWTNAVKSAVNAVTHTGKKVGLIGHFKDESSYYLNLFPEWQLIELDNLKNALSATPLREKYYRGEIDQQHFPPHVQHFLQYFQQSQWYPKLQQHYQRQDMSIINQSNI